MILICGFYPSVESKKNEQTKYKQTHRPREQIRLTRRGGGCGVSKIRGRGQVYSEGWITPQCTQMLNYNAGHVKLT